MHGTISRATFAIRAASSAALVATLVACSDDTSTSSLARNPYGAPPTPQVSDTETAGLYGIVFLFFAAVVGTVVWFYFAKKRGDTALGPKLGVLGGLAGGAVFGVVASQYFPFLGSIEKFGEPWSRARMSLIGIHVIVVGIVGAAIGFLVAWLRARPKAAVVPAATPAAGASARLAELKSLHEQGLLSDAEYESKRAEVVKAL